MANKVRSLLLARVLGSIFFRRSNNKASRYARSSKSLFELIQQVANKTSSLGVAGSFSAAKEQVNLLVRMLRSYARGEYKGLPWKSLVRIVAVLIYFVSPLDLVPDFLPILGLTDDIALLLWVVNALGEDIEKFRRWENDRTSIKIG